MDTKDLRRRLREDSDADLSRYLDELNNSELAAQTVQERITARETAMVVANVLVNRKAAALIASRRRV